MIQVNGNSIAERFMRYVQIDTQSDPQSNAQPTTEKQKDLSKILLAELKQMGIAAELDEYGYIYATIPSNSDKKMFLSFVFAAMLIQRLIAAGQM